MSDIDKTNQVDLLRVAPLFGAMCTKPLTSLLYMNTLIWVYSPTNTSKSIIAKLPERLLALRRS